MKFELPLDKPALIDTIRKAYGVAISGLTFLPEGWVGSHYLADTRKGRRYFLTLLNDSRLARLQQARLDFTLALICRLYESNLFRSVVPPLRTVAGELKADFQGHPLVLYDYIPGGNLASSRPYSADILHKLGQLVARLHRVTPHLGVDVPYMEDFNLPFEADLLSSLQELEQIGFHCRPSLQTLHDVLLPQREIILGLLDHLHELGQIGKKLQAPMVLVHTDLTPSNLLHTPAGDMIVVDWEGVRLAPAEQDLALLTETGFPILLAEYLQEASHPSLYPQLFAYYFYRRTLEDLADFLVQFLHENTTAEQDQHDLKELQKDWLDCLPFLEKSEAWAAGQLRLASEP